MELKMELKDVADMVVELQKVIAEFRGRIAALEAGGTKVLVKCARCKGLGRTGGWAEEKVTCKVCNGVGQLRI